MNTTPEKASIDQTMRFRPGREGTEQVEAIMLEVYSALQERGYDPISQIVGYILSGDPTYITSYKNARSLIRRIDRDELLDEFVHFYLAHLDTLKEKNR